MKKLEEQRIEHIIARMLSDRSVDAPDDAIRYARNLYRTRQIETKTSILQRVVAVLNSDLAPNRAAFGERSAAGGQARQMLFDSCDNAVDLRITTAKKGFDIKGQILGDGFANGSVKIANDKISLKINIDKNSAFEISGLPAGEYRLTATGSSSEIVIEKLDIR